MNREHPDVHVGFRGGTGTSNQIANICWIIEKAKEFQKTSTSDSLTMLKPLTTWITKNWKILQQLGIPGHLTCLLRNLYAGQEATELDMEQWSDSKLRKEYIKAVSCHPAYLTSMQSASCEMLGQMKLKVESRLQGEISITSYTQMTPPLRQKEKN